MAPNAALSFIAEIRGLTGAGVGFGGGGVAGLGGGLGAVGRGGGRRYVRGEPHSTRPECR